MDNQQESQGAQHRVEEAVAPPARTLTLPEIAGQLGVSLERLQEIIHRGELREDVHLGRLMVEVRPDVQPERLVAGTTRYKARMAQRAALEHFFERLMEPVIPQRSI